MPAKPKKKKKPSPAAKTKKRSAAAPEAVSDKSTPLKRDAVTPAERRATLDWALDNPWANSDVARVERVDVPAWHGWEMWRL